MSEAGPGTTGQTDGGTPAGSARADALRWLAARPLTEAELRTRLSRKGHDPEAVEQTLAALRHAGWIDDRRLALDWIVLRASRLGRGRERLLRELERRGVPPGTARAAWAEAVAAGDVDAAAVLRDSVGKRLRRHGGALGPAEFRRVYNALLREGHEPGAIVEALRPHTHLPDPDEA